MKMKAHIKIIVFTITILLTTKTSGQSSWGESDYSIINYTASNGLSSNEISDIIEDSLGVIWMGTSNGLTRFDGYQFKNFRSDFQSSDLFLSNNIKHITVDKNNKFWIVTDREITLFNPATQESNPIHNMDLSIIKRIKSLCITSDNKLLIGTSNGLYLYNNKSDTIKLIHKGYINSIFQDSHHNIWIGTWGQGAYVYDLLNHSIALRIDETFEKGMKITGFAEDSNHRIWISTWDSNGLYRLDIQSSLKDANKAKLKNFHISEKKGMIHNPVLYKILYDKKFNVLWVATAGGLFRMKDLDTEDSFEAFDKTTLNGDEVWNIHLSSNGVLWAAIMGSGVSKIIKSPKDFVSLRAFNISNIYNYKRKSHIVTSITEIQDSLVLFGTRLGVLDIWDRRTNKMFHYKSSDQFNGIDSKSNAVLSAVVDTIHHLTWIATRYDGVYFINHRNKSIHRLRDQHPAIRFTIGVTIKHDGTILIATTNKIFSLTFLNKDYTEYTILDYKNVNSFIGNANIQSITNYDNHIWIGTDISGIICTYEDNIIAKYSVERANINYNNVSTFYIDSDNILWIGTLGGGLSYYDKQTDKFKMIDSVRPISDNQIYSIIEDDSDQLWIASGKGIIKMDKHDYTQVRLYTENEGIRNNQFIPGAVCRLSDSTIIFGGYNGVDCHLPHHADENTYNFKTAIVDISIMNENIKNLMSQKEIECDALPPYTHHLVLKHNLNNIAISFSDLSYMFTDSKSNIYAYKMDGIDKDWSISDYNQRNVSYNNLKPGDYQFIVKSSISNGIWTEPYILKIHVLTPPWLTWWAFIGYFVSFVLILYWAYKDIKKKITLRNKLRIEQIEHKKSEEINNEKLKFFTNISHELFTPLSVMQCSIDRFSQQTETDQEVLSIMKMNVQRLQRLLQQIMEFRKAESGNLKLKVSRNNIVPFIAKLCHENFQPLLERKQISLSFYSEQESYYAYFDVDKVDKIMYNLLSNAMKYNYKNGAILVSVSEVLKDEQKYIALKVENTGDGIPESKIPFLFKRFYEGDYRKFKTQGTGIGLSLTKDLIDLHKGFINVHSIQGETTIFTVLIPADKESYSEDEIDRSSEASIPELPQTIQNKGCKLLLVEDDEELLLVMSKVLASYFNVVTATNGREALTLLENDNENIDFIVTDYIMPEMDGVEFCKEIKKNSTFSHIPIIMLTARTQVEHQLAGYNAGVDAYVSKPIEMSVLIAQIQTMLHNRQLIIEAFKSKDNLGTEEMQLSQLDKEFLETAISVIEQNIENSEFGNDEFAQKMNMSPSTLYRRLKSITGMSGNEFIRNVRIKKACMLLKNPDLQVSEIAYMVGFTDPKYFGVVFKKEKGVSPTKYIENLQNK